MRPQRMRPYNVTFDKRGPKAGTERRRCEVCLGGSGGMPPGNFLNLESLKCHFLDFGGKFDRNPDAQETDYNVSKFAIRLEFSSST